MKKSLSVVAVCLSFAAGVYAQGTVDFRNKVSAGATPFDSPVYMDFVGGTKLGNANFVAQLWYGASASSVNTALLDTPAVFRTGTGAGYWNPGADSTRVLPTIAGGTAAWVQVRVWDSTKGADYNAAKAAGSLYGDSNIFQLTTGNPTGSPPTVPAVLAGLTPFALVPEPSTFALGLLGAAALLFRRRK